MSEKIQKTEEKFTSKLPVEQFFNKIKSQIFKTGENREIKEKLRALFLPKKEGKEDKNSGGKGAGERAAEEKSKYRKKSLAV